MGLQRVTELIRVIGRFGIRPALAIVAKRPTIVFSHLGRRYEMLGDGSASYHLLNSIDKVRELAMAVSPADRTILDVGAHSGLFSAFAAERAPAARVVAVDADPIATPVIARNLAPHGNATILSLAVGAKPGTADFYRNSLSTQTSSLLRSAVRPFASESSIEVLPVTVTTLDELWRNELDCVPIDVLKVDVQGAEGAVLAGGQAALASVRTLVIEVSVLAPDAGEILTRLAAEFGVPEIVGFVAGGADLKYVRSRDG
jgi:FkbM family methyltransferase